MALTRRSESNTVYLEAKYYRLWQGLKKHIEGCETIEANNPKTGEKVTKYGYSYDTVSGLAVRLVKYDTEKKHPTRYFGFKLHLAEGNETYVLDMPYNSQILRRFLKVARNFDWETPLSITIFKGKKKDGSEELGVWFQQRGETVKPYYTREQPRGMPEAIYDDTEARWDFRAQHRWLVAKLQDEIIPDIEAATARVAPPVERHADAPEEPNGDESEIMQPFGEITDDDVPF